MLTFGDAMLSREQALLDEPLQHRAHRGPMHQLQDEQVGLRRDGGLSCGPSHHPPSAGTLPVTHTAAGGDSDLDSVSARLADVLQVERLVGGLVVTTLDGERRGVDAHLHGGRPVGVHLPVLVVVALELQLQVRPGGRQGVGRGCVRTRTTAPRVTTPCCSKPRRTMQR